MHPHYHARVPSLGSTARVHVNPIDGYQCSNELRAQLNLTNDHKRKKHHTCKDVLLPRMSCKWLRSGCLLRKGKVVVVASNYASLRKGKEARYSGQLFNTHSTDV